MASIECEHTAECRCPECELEKMIEEPPAPVKKKFKPTSSRRSPAAPAPAPEPARARRPSASEVLAKLEEKREFPSAPIPVALGGRGRRVEPLGMMGADGKLRVGLTKLANGREVIDTEVLAAEMEDELEEVNGTDVCSMEFLQSLTCNELRDLCKARYLRTSPLVCKAGESIACKAELMRRIYNFDHDIPLEPKILRRGNRRSASEAEGRYAWNDGYKPSVSKGIRNFTKPRKCYKVKATMGPNKPGNLQKYMKRKEPDVE